MGRFARHDKCKTLTLGERNEGRGIGYYRLFDVSHAIIFNLDIPNVDEFQSFVDSQGRRDVNDAIISKGVDGEVDGGDGPVDLERRCDRARTFLTDAVGT